MKQLQNNFTTPKQSKRLLKLGLPADSADCYLEINSGIEWVRKIPQNISDKPLCYTDWLIDVALLKSEYYIPCWSVGRLIEIWYICVASRERIGYSGSLPFVERIVSRFEESNDAHLIDFSKLE